MSNYLMFHLNGTTHRKEACDISDHVIGTWGVDITSGKWFHWGDTSEKLSWEYPTIDKVPTELRAKALLLT